MRRLLVVLPLVTSACSAMAGTPDCDKAALENLGGELDTLTQRDAIRKVWPGVKAACGESLSDAAKLVFEPYKPPGPDQAGEINLARGPDKQFRKMTLNACPEWEEVAAAVANAPADLRAVASYQGCKFDRYGVLTQDEISGGTSASLITWGMHQWMLDQGVDSAKLRPITRALYGLERRSMSLFISSGNENLPVAEGVPVEPGVAIVIGADELVFNEKKLVSIKDGQLDVNALKTHLIVPLYDALVEEADIAKSMAEQRQDEWEARALIVADANTSFATLVNVMFTAGRAEYKTYSILVESENGFDFASIPINPPSFTSAPIPRTHNGILDFVPGGTGSNKPIQDGKAHADDAGSSKTKSGLYAMKGPKDAIPQMARNFDPDMAARNAGILAAVEGSGDFSPGMTIEVTPGSFTLSQGGGHPDAPVAGTDDDFSTVTKYAQAVKAKDGKAHRVVLSATNDTPLQRIVSALEAARGKDCKADGTGCILGDVIITAEGAHRHNFGPISPFNSGWAVGGDDDDVWGGLTGTEIGEAYGVGGLGLVGTGRGGGGTEEGTIGLGNTGLIGKGGGGGTGSGYGRGSGAGFGGKGKPVPRVRQAKAKVSGPLDKDIIRRIVRAHINEVRSCYNQGLTKDPKLQGRVAIDFVITTTGKVGSSEVKETSLKDKNVANCIAKAVKRWKFPKPRGGGKVTVTYPFTLSPG